MIKARIKACGTVSSVPEQKATQEGKPFTAFVLSVDVADPSTGETTTIPVSVGAPSIMPYDVSDGQRLGVSGTLLVKGSFGGRPFFNLWAESFGPSAPDKDSMEGTLEFLGTAGKDIQVRRTRTGRDFLRFAAFSSDKAAKGDRTFTWVRFRRFQNLDDNPMPPFLVPKAKIKVSGTFEVSVFKGAPSLSCRVSSMSPWTFEDKPATED